MSNRIEQLLEFLKESPNDNFLRYALAQEYVKAGQKETGYEYYLGLINDAPDYVATYYHCIEIAQKIGDQHSLSELQSAKLELEMEDLL